MTTKVKPGLFIVLEGMDCSGKSSQVNMLKEAIEERGYRVHVTREPGGTPMAEEIRSTLLKKRDEKVHALTEILLFGASRHQHVENVIKPLVEEGVVVISDRFTDSSYAYQGCGRERMISFLDVEQMVLEGFRPDHVLYFDVTLEEALLRQRRRSDKQDRLDEEQTSFKEKVYEGYRERADEYCDHTHFINANCKMEEVVVQLKEWVELSGLFPLKEKPTMGRLYTEMAASNSQQIPTARINATTNGVANWLRDQSFVRKVPTKLGGSLLPLWANPDAARTHSLPDPDAKQMIIHAKSVKHPDAPTVRNIFNAFNRRPGPIHGEYGQPKRNPIESSDQWMKRLLVISEKHVCVEISNPRFKDTNCFNDPLVDIEMIVDVLFTGPLASIAEKQFNENPNADWLKYRMIVGPDVEVPVTWDFCPPLELTKEEQNEQNQNPN